jgi:hypothetical protein
MRVTRRNLFGMVSAALAAKGLKAIPLDPTSVNMDGGDLGRATVFASPDPKECGVFAIEFHKTSPALENALQTLADHGAALYPPDGLGARSFPVYGASGGLLSTHIVYFLVPNVGRNENWQCGLCGTRFAEKP